MIHCDGFWRLEHLSDAQLLESLGKVLGTQQRALAEIVAHLGEVEDRRLHLKAAHSSLFAYCVAQLGMSEDEACRRIDLARLARKFPALFAELASGQITLSVALVLKPALSPGNHLELLRAARGKSIRQARELVAERFPKPDAPSSIRKLPEQRPPSETAATGSRLPTSADCPLLRSPEATTLAGPATPPSLSPTAPPVASPRCVGLPGAAPSVASLPSASLPGDASPATVPPRLTPPPLPSPLRRPFPLRPVPHRQRSRRRRRLLLQHHRLATAPPLSLAMSSSRSRRDGIASSSPLMPLSNYSSSERATCCATRTPAATSPPSSRAPWTCSSTI